MTGGFRISTSVDEIIALRATTVGQPIFQSWFNSVGSRRGYFGFGSTSSNELMLNNEHSGGNIKLQTFNGFISLIGDTTVSGTVTATSLPVFENNAAASSLAVGQFYRTSTGVLMVKF